MLIRKILLLIFAILLASLFAGCGTDSVAVTSNNSSTTPIVFSTIYKGAHADLGNSYRSPTSTDPNIMRIETQPDLNAFWTWFQTHNGAGNRPIPVIDFANEVIIVITDVFWSTGGHSIEVLSVDYAQGVVTLNILRTVPAPGALVLQSAEQPYTVIQLAKPAQDFGIKLNLTTKEIQ